MQSQIEILKKWAMNSKKRGACYTEDGSGSEEKEQSSYWQDNHDECSESKMK